MLCWAAGAGAGAGADAGAVDFFCAGAGAGAALRGVSGVEPTHYPASAERVEGTSEIAAAPPKSPQFHSLKRLPIARTWIRRAGLTEGTAQPKNCC